MFIVDDVGANHVKCRLQRDFWCYRWYRYHKLYWWHCTDNNFNQTKKAENKINNVGNKIQNYTESFRIRIYFEWKGIVLIR